MCVYIDTINGYMYVCLPVCVNVCVRVSLKITVWLGIDMCERTCTKLALVLFSASVVQEPSIMYVHVHVQYVCMYVCMYVCVHVCV